MSRRNKRGSRSFPSLGESPKLRPGPEPIPVAIGTPNASFSCNAGHRASAAKSHTKTVIAKGAANHAKSAHITCTQREEERQSTGHASRDVRLALASRVAGGVGLALGLTGTTADSESGCDGIAARLTPVQSKSDRLNFGQPKDCPNPMEASR